MLHLKRVHHIAVICSDYTLSKQFYTGILGLTVIKETYRTERQSYKLDLALNGEYIIELFSFPCPPQRLSRPEAAGLRHLAFEVDDIDTAVQYLKKNNITVEEIRVDELTGKKFAFFADPDNLPLEFYQQ